MRNRPTSLGHLFPSVLSAAGAEAPTLSRTQHVPNRGKNSHQEPFRLASNVSPMPMPNTASVEFRCHRSRETFHGDHVPRNIQTSSRAFPFFVAQPDKSITHVASMPSCSHRCHIPGIRCRVDDESVTSPGLAT